MPISIFVFRICAPIENHQSAFPFKISHDLCYTAFLWDTQQHVNVVWASLHFYDFYVFCSHSFLRIYPISFLICPYIVIRRHFDAKTT